MSCRVLILEDDLAFNKLLQIRLKAWRSDLQITHCTHVADAKSALDKDEPYDLVIFDQHLPDGRSLELFSHPKLEYAAKLAVSSDASAEMPASTVIAGAQHFLGKRQVSEPLFAPLLGALIHRVALEKELAEVKQKQLRVETVKALVATLQHEINNPLGAMFGSAYLMKNFGELTTDQQKALDVIEQSSERIKNVIKNLCEAIDLDLVTKGQDDVFHIPGDKPWGK